MNLNLTGKTALVTGREWRHPHGVAEALAEAGAPVPI